MRKRTALGLLLAVLVVAGALALVFLRPGTLPDMPGDRSNNDRANATTEIINRGEYLARAGDCVACHTELNGPEFAGGRPMPTPFGNLYAPNITPDDETGIGLWTADEFYRMMHEGISKDGTLLYPAMPFANYTNVTREDSDAIYAYLLSVPPVRLQNKPEQWNRGAYLVQGLGHCSMCHTAVNALGGSKESRAFEGGMIPNQNWYAPSLTSNREAGLGNWDLQDIADLLQVGTSKRGAVYGPMAEVVYNSLQYLTDEDAMAMAVYLKSLPPRDSDPLPTSQARLVEPSVMEMGRKIYSQAATRLAPGKTRGLMACHRSRIC
jgi:mono/diheme cytochrome c family protein